MKRSLILTALSFLVLAQLAWAQVPQIINYQGVLRYAGTKEIVPDGNYDITFKIWDAATGGTTLWTELHLNATTNAVPVADGVFNVILGQVTALPDPFPSPAWLEIVDGTGTPLDPRIELTAVPYALNAGGISGASNVFPSSGNVGIGTTTPENTLHVKGWFKLEGSDLIIADPTRGDGGRAVVHQGDGGGTNDLLILNHAGDFENGVSVEGSRLEVAGDLVANSLVGIGVSTPAEALDINGSIRVTNALYSTGELLLNSDTAWDLKLNDGNPGNVLMAGGGGKVGIGTATPTAMLHAYVPSGSGSILLEHPAASDLSFDLKSVNTDYSIKLSGLTLQFQEATTPIMTLNAGNVGIGMTSPQGLLHIRRSGGSQLMLGHNNQPNLEWYFDVDAVAKMTLQNEKNGSPMTVMAFDANNGNVGIGTATPSARLDVAGIARADTLQLATAAERWYSIPGPEFSKYSGSFEIDTTNLYVYSTGSWSYNYVSAGVHLPDGAFINGFAAKVEDNSSFGMDSASFAIKLLELTPGSAPNVIGFMSTSGATPGVQTPSGTVGATVDNANKSYLVTARWKAPGAPTYDYRALKLYNVRLNYTVTSPLP